jgi:hypothetical protein
MLRLQARTAIRCAKVISSVARRSVAMAIRLCGRRAAWRRALRYTEKGLLSSRHIVSCQGRVVSCATMQADQYVSTRRRHRLSLHSVRVAVLCLYVLKNCRLLSLVSFFFYGSLNSVMNVHMFAACQTIHDTPRAPLTVPTTAQRRALRATRHGHSTHTRHETRDTTDRHDINIYSVSFIIQVYIS